MARTAIFDDALEKLGWMFYPVAIAMVVAILIGVGVYLGLEFVVFGLYALVGLVAGALIYYGTSDVPRHTGLQVDERWSRTGVFVASAVTVGVVALTGQPMFVLVGLVVGSALIVHQLLAEPSPEQLLPQITVLFLLSPLTKYLTAGMYIGHGDIIDHVRVVEGLLASGSIQALEFTSYQDFPGLHLVAAAAGSLSGLGPYDGIMLVGLVAYAIVIPAVYLVVARLTDHPLLALCTAFGVAVIDDLSFFASYVFPQSLATVLIIVLFVLATLVARDAIKWRVAGLFAAVVVALTLTHHLTQVLFVPLLALGIVFYAIRGSSQARTVLFSRYTALLAFTGVITAVRLLQTGFFDRLFEAGALMIQGGALGGYTQSQSFGLGRAVAERSVWTALDWLASPYGLYLVVLVIVFSIGVVAFLRSESRPPAQATLFGLGAVGALLIFETPLAIQSLIRISFPWLFVFGFVIGIGVLKLRHRAGTVRQRRVVFAVIVLLAAVAPMVTADNYYELDPRPTIQTSFSEEEAAELQAMSTYVRDQQLSPTTLSLTRAAMRRYGATDTVWTHFEGGTATIPDGHFVYRSSWPDYKVHFTSVTPGTTLYANSLYVSDAWIDQRVASSSKVYTAGGVGMLWDSTDRPFTLD